MACILLLETATKVCSVGIAEDQKLLAFKESHSANSHSSVITSYINEVISESGKTKEHIDAVSVSMGPGSYTGLRIGVSTAKGLCYAWDRPLLAVNTLQSMSHYFISCHHELIMPDDLLCPMIDARRMEVYTALFDSEGNFIRDTSAEIITENSFSEILPKKKIFFFGDGSEKCRSVLQHNTNAVFFDKFTNSVKGMILPSFLDYDQKVFRDTAYFEPFYLKDFLATKPKKLI